MIDVPITESYELPSEGTHRATVVDVIDAGNEKSEINGKIRPLLDITFRIEDERDSDDEPIRLSMRVTKVVNKRSKLGRMIAALGIAVDFKAKRFPGLDEAILGKTLNVKIQHTHKGQGKFADVVDFPTSVPCRQAAAVVDDLEGV